MRLARFTALAGGLLALSLAGLSACGGSSGTSTAGGANASVTAGGTFVDIYSSLPMHGPSSGEALAVADGISLALAQAHGRAGPFTVRYTPLDDSTGPTGWDASQTAADARKAAADPQAVYYIGELDDGASEVSMPILNEAGIPQVSPTNTYAGLTVDASASGGPPYAPTGTRTFLRIVPVDSVEAAALLLAMKQAGCRTVTVSADQEPFGAGLAKLVAAENRYYGLDLVSDAGPGQAGGGYRSETTLVRRNRPDCVLLAGVASPRAVQLTEAIHAALPKAKIFAPGEMCTGAWTNPGDGGVSESIDPLIECTAVTRGVNAYPGGKAFLAAYRARFGGADPGPAAVLGYEAMKLGLSTIAGLGKGGDSKSAVLSALFSTTNRRSVLGTYSIDGAGDTTLRSYGLYRVGGSGNPVFVRTITPPRMP